MWLMFGRGANIFVILCSGKGEMLGYSVDYCATLVGSFSFFLTFQNWESGC